MHTHFFTRVMLLATALFVLLTAAAWADGGLGRHKKLFAVPAPGKVTIDGQLNDWDLSGQIYMYVMSETADTMSAKFALMYDATNLYISAVVRDTTPMMNRHDPLVTGLEGWNADSCQFRLTVDPKMGYPVNAYMDGSGDAANPNIVHLTLWHYTDKAQACLTMQTSMHYNSPHKEWGPFGVVSNDQFQGKYVKMPDNGGYTFEYSIPWTTLGATNPLKAGNLVAGTVQFNWGQADGLKTNGGWAYDVMAAPGFPYQSTSCWGKIIFAEYGNLPKEIVEEGAPPAKPLPLSFSYTLPQDSQITLQLVDKDHVVRRLLVAQENRAAGKNVEHWDGMDAQGKPLPPGEYTLRGIYHQPITTKFLFSPHNSGNPPYKIDNGKGAWGADHGTPTDACAFDQGVLLSWSVAEAGHGLIRTDLAGHKQWGIMDGAMYVASDGKHVFAASGASVRVLDIADARPLNFGNGTPTLVPPPGGEAAANTVTGLTYANGIIYVAYHDRNLLGLFDAESGNLKGTWSVPAPERLAVRPGGGLAVISGGKVLAVKDNVVTPLIAGHLDTPRGIAVGPDGMIYVANTGALQNISVSNTMGAYQRSIGTKGGRPAVGRYSAKGIYEPGGISIDKEGKLWVAETTDSPKRISAWNARTGKLVNEFFGGCDYFGYSYIDPKKPDEIYCHNVLWKIDWNKNTCTPYSTIWRSTTPNMMFPQGPSGYINHPHFFTAKNGKQYCFGNANFMGILSMRDGDVYKPFLALISLNRGYVYYGDKVQFPLMADAKQYPNGVYFWQDKNNDQTVQADELTPMPGESTSDIGWLDENLNLWRGTRKYTPVRMEGARPIYDLKVSQTMPYGIGWMDPDDGSSYGILAKYSTTGKVLWSYPPGAAWYDALGLPLQAPGRLWGLTQGLGVAGNFTGVSCYFNTYHLVTRDGVYVGMLMRDGRDGKGLGPDVTLSETITGQLVKLDNLPGSQGKSRYFLLAGAGDARVTEIFGLDTVKYLPDEKFVVSEADAKLAAEALAKYSSALARSQRMSIARNKSGLATAAAISRAFDGERNFSVRAAYDEKNLYLSYAVSSPSDLVNAQPDPNILFKGGNCLDIQLATDPTADPQRKTPAPGDLRILVTRKDGNPCVVIYRPKVKGFTGKPIVLTSPTGQESFDTIEVSKEIGLEYQKTPAGFTATVIIPQAAVGLALKPGQLLTLDVGYLYGNATGNQTAGRSYWVNNSFSANVTYDVPNESRLEPAEWGTALVE